MKIVFHALMNVGLHYLLLDDYTRCYACLKVLLCSVLVYVECWNPALGFVIQAGSLFVIC